jgi:hypothetical protein
VITCLAITVAAGLVYVALAEFAHWDMHQRAFWTGLLLIVVTGAICENAINFDAAHSASAKAITGGNSIRGSNLTLDSLRARLGRPSEAAVPGGRGAGSICRDQAGDFDHERGFTHRG